MRDRVVDRGVEIGVDTGRVDLGGTHHQLIRFEFDAVEPGGRVHHRLITAGPDVDEQLTDRGL